MLVVLCFVGRSLAKLFFELVSANLFLLLSCAAVHVLNDGISHPIHELLGALLSLFDFIQTILLLLIKHAGVFFLSTNVLETFSLTLSQSLSLVLLVLSKHLLEVLLLLLSLFLLKTALSIHFFLKALNKSNLLGVSLLLLDFASVFVFVELLVSSLFLLHDALLKFGSLL